jgi:hypothetical protein
VHGLKETEMKLHHLTFTVLMVAGWLLAGSCAIDDREVAVALPLNGLGDGDASAGSSEGSLGGSAGLPPGAPRLSVSAQAIDLGWVTTGFPARARVVVDNLGAAPLPAPAVGFAEGSHADFWLIQNGCAREVAPGESCELRVQLVPSDAGERAALLEVRSEVGGEAQVAIRALALGAGDLILAPVAGSFEDFGSTRVGSSQEETFSISNPTQAASGPLRFHSNRPEFELLAPREGDCIPDQTALAGGESCTLHVAFTPGERGPFEATLTGASDSVGAVSVTLVGRGMLPAALRASAPALDFSGVVLGSSARRSVQLENSGDESLTLAGARLEPAGAAGFSILNSDCGEGMLIDGGAHCRVQLEFRPTTVGDELTAQLLAEGSAAGQAQSVALRGVGLEPGALGVSAAAEGDDDFGEVLVGETSERRFSVQNPSAQASGVLDFALSDGFVLSEPPEAGECVPGSTSLVDGESCSVRVRFVPSRRELFTGSLTVSSSLAGAAALPLEGRGVGPAALSVAGELNFGRVLTGTSGVRSLTIENEGDQPLPPPRFELSGNSPAQVAAFSFESQCSAPLASGAACNVNLTFAPTAPTPHAVTLSVASEGGNTSVLLLGLAQLPGTLVLTAVESAAFGEVPIGTSTTRSFVLDNPGEIPSGRLTISSDNNRFEIDLGDCDPEDPEGLQAGASCTFGVRFTPGDNLPQAANLTVQSPGAGRAGISVSGLGRQPASLSATGNRDLGRAYVGQDTLTVPQNEFTWTVNNLGDLPTGTLALENDNPTEFAIRNDTCSGAALAGRASCDMTIRFRAGAAGNRSARVLVADGEGGRSAALALTGLGVQLAVLGQSCVNAECAAGVCTRGVCCNTACDRTCQACSAQGQCVDQSSQEACGNGAACFGVDNCKLPAGRGCSQNGGDAQCGSGNCEQRLGGSGAGDRICCLDDCGNGLQCNAQNRCQAPALGRGESCGAPGQAACEAGLVCKPCSGGGNRCELPNACCGGCPVGSTCINGTTCSECTDGQTRCIAGGSRQQCVGGLWQNANCPGSLQCQGQGTCGCNTGAPCNNQCVNTADDENNCGQCGSFCASTCIGGVCRAGDGGNCNGNIDCASGLCQAWAFDRDSDGFGLQSTFRKICGAQPPSDQPGGGAGVWRRVNESVPVNQRFDCCDTDANASPSQTNFRPEARSGCAGPPGDFNCDGREDRRFELLSGTPAEVLSGFETCGDLGTNCASIRLIWLGGEPPACGTPRGSAGASQCLLVDGQCQSIAGAGIALFCL